MEEFEKLVAESFQNELLPVSDNGAKVASAGVSDPQVESEPAVASTEMETASTESPAAGENDPAA